MRPPVEIGLTIDCVPSVEDPGMWRAIVTSWHGIEIYWHDAEDRQTALAGAREAVRAIVTEASRTELDLRQQIDEVANA